MKIAAESGSRQAERVCGALIDIAKDSACAARQPAAWLCCQMRVCISTMAAR